VIEACFLVSRLKALAHRDGISSVTVRISTVMIAYNHKNTMSNKNGTGKKQCQIKQIYFWYALTIANNSSCLLKYFYIGNSRQVIDQRRTGGMVRSLTSGNSRGRQSIDDAGWMDDRLSPLRTGETGPGEKRQDRGVGTKKEHGPEGGDR
jgi:hypothetical protein